MRPLPRHRRLLAITTFAALVPAACSVEQTSNRCAKESTSLDGLVACVRDMHAAARRCEPDREIAAALPVAGRRVLKFGEATKYGGTSRGIVFEGADLAEVHAPIGGTVTFADTWRSYGELMIIDACAKVALIAGTFSADVIAGQVTSAGEPVARMRKTSSDAPVLYLEMRENGAAIDPARLIPQL